MKFFFPDSQDLVDPSFDFDAETRSEDRIRQRDDLYAHEVFDTPPYDGILVSKAIVDGSEASAGKYTFAQRRRFYSDGVREFFRLPSGLRSMGDCGAFNYVREDEPPVTVEEVASFYEEGGFDYGASVDHVILQYNAAWDRALPGVDPVPENCRRRQEITFDRAEAFWKLHRRDKYSFEPMGVAQGWSPRSYSDAVRRLQAIGYRYIALGGLVPLKSRDVLETLAEVAETRRSDVRLHLFGITRLEHVEAFAGSGVVSFDSTSPLRQAFKEDYGNYYGDGEGYAAIRVPQVDANPSLKKMIASGEVDQAEAIRLERACLDALREFGAGEVSLEVVLDLLVEYQTLFKGKRDYRDEYRRLLSDRPWEKCPCSVCRAIGIDVVLFRGAERNRRRGFHNVYVTEARLRRIVDASVSSS